MPPWLRLTASTCACISQLLIDKLGRCTIVRLGALRLIVTMHVAFPNPGVVVVESQPPPVWTRRLAF